jgi:hypothetical protein
MSVKRSYVSFPMDGKLLCSECLQQKEMDLNAASSSYEYVMRNDCQVRMCVASYGMSENPIWNCSCICKSRYSEKCKCHEHDRHFEKICYCCQICRYATTPLLNSVELEQLKSRGVVAAGYDICGECERYVYHRYSDKNGVEHSDRSLKMLHQVVKEREREREKCTSAVRLS